MVKLMPYTCLHMSKHMTEASRPHRSMHSFMNNALLMSHLNNDISFFVILSIPFPFISFTYICFNINIKSSLLRALLLLT